MLSVSRSHAALRHPIPRHGRRGAEMAMLGILCAGGALLLFAGRHLTFFFDEWDFIFGRRGESIHTYLAPHNGHLSLVPVVVYKLLLATVGLRHYWPYLAVDVLLHLLSVSLLYVLARRRLGAWVAILPAALLLFMGSAYQDLLWAFQIGFLGSVVGGLGALALLDPTGPQHDVRATIMLLLSVCSSAVGIPFVAAAAAMLVAQRAPARRLWVAAAPAPLFVIWYLTWGTSEHTSLDSVLAAPQYIADAATAAAAGVAGMSSSYGPALSVALLAVISVAPLRRRKTLPALLVAAIVGSTTFWGLSAVARADNADPSASRYLYVGAVFILLALADSLRDVAIPRARVAMASLFVLAAVVANTNLLRQGERGLRSVDIRVRASLTALRVAAPVVSPSFEPDPKDAPQIHAGSYLSAVRSWGTPALTLSQLRQASLGQQVQADRTIENAEGIAPNPVRAIRGSRSLSVSGIQGGPVASRGMCKVFSPSSVTDFIDLAADPGTALEVSPRDGSAVRIYLIRFATQFGEPPLGQSNVPVSVRFPNDSSRTPWQIRLTSAQPITVCAS